MFNYTEEENTQEDIIEEKKYPYDEIDVDGKVVCQVCGKSYSFITPAHLKTHDITMEQYRLRFKDVAIASDKLKTQKKYNKSQLFEKKEEDEFKEFYDQKNVPDVEEFNIIEEVKKYEEEKVEETIDEIVIEEPIVKTEDFNILEYKAFKENKEIIRDPVAKMKSRILKTLKSYFPNIQSDYMIKKKSMLGNKLIYVYITDYCDPILKVNVEFPDTFWHNSDIIIHPNRDGILKADGWSVIRIKGNAPTNEEIKKCVESSF